MGRYKLVRCPKCKHWQIVYAGERFKCRWCKYSTHLKHLRIFYQSDDFNEVYTMYFLYSTGKLKVI